jgi:hypothetical protein
MLIALTSVTAQFNAIQTDIHSDYYQLGKCFYSYQSSYYTIQYVRELILLRNLSIFYNYLSKSCSD